MKKDDPNRGWPLQIVGFFEQPPSKLSVPASVLGVIFFTALLVIGFFATSWLLVDLLSGDQKRAAEATKAALPVLAGAIGLPLIIWRLLILDRQTRISEDKTQIDRETHFTSIFSRSIDQLGQTRDAKSTPEDGETESVTRTVPNIEVRLGGVHSLVRLAEESARDREKIQNVLVSYVRENSWSDRNGVVTSPLQRARNSTADWSIPYMRGSVTPEIEAKLKTWQEREEDQTKRRRAWARTLRETRVDVTEALEAIPKVRNELVEQESLRFYESLFVGVRFEARVLNISRFDRCIFANCTFASASKYNFANSSFVDCALSEVLDAEMFFSRCTIDHLSIRGLTKTSANFTGCSASNLSISNAKGHFINLSHSTLYELWLSGEGEVELKLTYADLVGGRIMGLRAESSSDFDGCSIANTKFDSVDLTKVEKIRDHALERTVGNAGTRHPASRDRPTGWEQFDPEYKDDDIPF